MTDERNFTNGELRTFKECRRKWWLGWYRKLRPRVQDVAGTPAALGTRVHEALSAYYSREPRNPFVVLEQGVLRDKAAFADDLEKIAAVEKDVELARIMLEGYVEWLQETGADQGLRIVGDEVKLKVPMPGLEGVNLMGKLDLRVEREVDGARLFLDHKTVGGIDQATQMLHMDEQMLHYHLLEYLQLQADKAAGTAADDTRTAGALYNMLRKVKRTARANPPFYERVEVRHNPRELESYFKRVWGEVHDVLSVERRLAAGEDSRIVVYPTPTRDCTWKCEFRHVCPLFDDGSAAEEMVAALYETGNPLDRYETQEAEA